jgi:ring-1,2-phenylacetyl-CoA epoxidase subunit PaaC
MADSTLTQRDAEPTIALFAYVLRHGDDCLILAQRLGDLVSRAPELEEDIALANIALDILGTGRRLLQYAGEIEGAGRSEDDLAFGRTEREFTNLLLVEVPNGDFGQTMARQFCFDAYHDLLWNRLVESSDETIAGIAGKARKESAYHLRHSRLWVLRLGDGTDESHRRMQAGLDAIWRFTAEMFIDDDVDRAAAESGYGVLPSSLRDDWVATITDAIAEATLHLPEDTSVRTGGRDGRHSEEIGPLLAEMQHMYRSFPGASW